MAAEMSSLPRHFAGIYVFLALLVPAFAHPGIGIVADSKGNVYYTDLKQVWRVAPDGARIVAVPAVHSHELYLDADDNLYGEHLWYDGAHDEWWHYVWRRTPDGVISRVIPATRGFQSGYSFVRDRAGNHYYYRDKKLFRTSPEGVRPKGDKKESFIAGGAAGQADGQGEAAGFADVMWLFASPDGTLFLIDNGKLRRIAADGSATTLAGEFAPRSRFMFWVGERHALMGLYADGPGNVFVANHGARMVEKVAADGKRTVFLRSGFPWGPTGVTVHNGDVFVLEYQINAVRVRRVGKDGSVKVIAE